MPDPPMPNPARQQAYMLVWLAMDDATRQRVFRVLRAEMRRGDAAGMHAVMALPLERLT